MVQILKNNFFNRDACEVGEKLLGCYLVRRFGQKIVKVKITEVEVYDGFNDKASHASRGRTERNKIMFGKSGRFYVYLVYGMHNMLNIVTGDKGYPSAILIRGGMFDGKKLNGPGVLTKFLKIDKKFNDKIADYENNLWFESGGEVAKNQIKKLPRVGIDYAGDYWKKRKLRFVLE